MSYLKYANISASLVRRALKEPYKTEALRKEVSGVQINTYVEGKQVATGVATIHEMVQK